MFGASAGSFGLLCPRLTSATPSRRLSTPLAQGRVTDLPGIALSPSRLSPPHIRTTSSVQVLDFEDIRPLIRIARLLYGFCSSGQRFACGFLQIPPHGGHPCRPANDSPCWARRGLSPPSKSALPGAQQKR